MVTRVDKFLGGLSADVTNVANVHATENRIAFGHGDTNPTANVHVIGDVLATTGFVVPNDGDIGSVGATDAIQISSGGIVTFKDDIKIKDGGTIGSASDAAAITIAASGQVTFSDVATFSGGLKVPDDGDIGSASVTDAIQISSAGIVTFKDDILIKDGGTIGVASKTDAVTIAADGDTAIAGGLGIAGNTAPVATALSLGTPANVVVRTHAASGSGNVIIGDATATSSHSLDVRGTANTGALTGTTGTFSGRLVVDDTTEATTTTDGSLQTDGGLSVAGDAVFGDDIKLVTDAAVASFGQNGEITLTHVHNTGLLLEDSGGSPTLQFHDAGESVSSDGSKLILTSNSVAFDMPTADGNANEVLKTDGSGALSFTAISSNAITSGDTVVNTIDPNITFVTNGAEEARITAAGNLVLGSTTATHLLDIRGTANTGVLTASGLTFPSSDGSANQAMVTDGSGVLSFATVLTSSDPATTLAATPDLGSVASGGSQDAFGQNLGGLTETDLLDEPSGSLSTLDAGALS